jgi:hypothetical protein
MDGLQAAVMRVLCEEHTAATLRYALRLTGERAHAKHVAPGAARLSVVTLSGPTLVGLTKRTRRNRRCCDLPDQRAPAPGGIAPRLEPYSPPTVAPDRCGQVRSREDAPFTGSVGASFDNALAALAENLWSTLIIELIYWSATTFATRAAAATARDSSARRIYRRRTWTLSLVKSASSGL